MIKATLNLQDVFLNQVRKENVPVTIFMTNGFQLKGTIIGFDSFTIVMESEGKQQLVYKSAVSTVCPSKAVNVIFADNRSEPPIL